MGVLKRKRIVLGVSGSIAAYKAADIASELIKQGVDLHVVLTPTATRFITKETFRALTGRTPLIDLFDEVSEGSVSHIATIQNADLLLIAPATADVIGKLASGMADDMLTTLALVAKCPVLIAPAMNTNMWTNPIVVSNVDRLKAYNYSFVEPAEGRLACGTEGVGKLADVQTILDQVTAVFGVESDLAGKKILVTAGPTREPVDPVRYLSNYSSGRMGFSIADAAKRRGAEVVLVTGPSEAPIPEAVDVIRIQTSAEMLAAVQENFNDVDIIIGAAAVADFSPVPAPGKVKKKDGAAQTIELSETVDILASVGKSKGQKILVGFALETEELATNALKKLKSKNLDLIVANAADETNQPFGPGPSRVRVFSRLGDDLQWPLMSKQEIAEHLLSFIRDRFINGA